MKFRTFGWMLFAMFAALCLMFTDMMGWTSARQSLGRAFAPPPEAPSAPPPGFIVSIWQNLGVPEMYGKLVRTDYYYIEYGSGTTTALGTRYDGIVASINNW